MSPLSSLNLSHRFQQLPRSFYSVVKPQPLENTRWVVWNHDFARHFTLPEQLPQGDLKRFLAGELQQAKPTPCLAMKYAGHQFGAYNPALGDGRGLLLGEITNQSGVLFDLHLKGAGITPYSRGGDGRAVLRSTIREYLCSEAMAGLGIPTTRALGMLTSDTMVYREKSEQGALLLRMTESHIRFGHFEHFFYTNQITELKLLADKVIEWHMPECQHAEKPYLEMFKLVVASTANMIAHWQAYGFAHGVMNTDNMSILGQTFDYGPYGFLDDYAPGYVSNHSDYEGRYAFDQQPKIGMWNLTALAHSLSPLVDVSDLESALSQYEISLGRTFSQLMRNKLGLHTKLENDSELFQSMFELLERDHVDYTRFMRELSDLDSKDPKVVMELFIDRDAAKSWLDVYMERCERELDASGFPVPAMERCKMMRCVNPKYILRNYLAQLAIDKAEEGDFSEVNQLTELLKRPYDEQEEMEDYAKLPPEWGKRMEISCSS